jgi:hypothetical protein
MWLNGMNRTITITLILIIVALSIMMIPSTSASSNPSVPEFTVKQVDRSYDVATTYSKNQYTGETITHPGYRVQKLTIEVTIKNQPFNRSEAFGNITGLFYNVQMKDSFTDWASSASSDSHDQYGVAASTSENTIITFVLGTEGWCVLPGSQVDIRVQAVTGTEYTVWPLNGGCIPIGTQFALKEASSWSSPQTIIIGIGVDASQPAPSPSSVPMQSIQSVDAADEPTQNPIQTPTQQSTQSDAISDLTWEDAALAVACAVIVCLAAALVLSRRKRL